MVGLYFIGYYVFAEFTLHFTDLDYGICLILYYVIFFMQFFFVPRDC